MTSPTEDEKHSEIAHASRKSIQNIILASGMLTATAIFVIYLLLLKPFIHDDIIRYLAGLRLMDGPIIQIGPISFSVFFTLLYFIHHEILGGKNPEFAFRLAAIVLCLAMFLVIWAIERSMLEKQSSVSLYFSRLIPLAGLFFVFNPVFITLHALAKQYILMFFMLGYVLTGYLWYHTTRKGNSNFSLLRILKSLIWLFLVFLSSFLAFLSSVLCVILFLFTASFLIEMTATIEGFKVRFLANFGIAFATGSAALFARDFVIQGNYSEHSPLDETTNMVTASLEILQVLPFPESYVLIPIAGVFLLEFIRTIVSVFHAKLRFPGFPLEGYQLWRNRAFIAIVFFSMFWMSVNREGALNVIHENLSLAFLFIWVGWIAFQSSLKSTKEAHESQIFGFCQVLASLLLILLLFMIFIFPDFNIHPTFPNDRLTIFLIIPFSFLGAYNLQTRKYDIFDLVVTFILPPIVIAGVLFLAMPPQFSILNLWLYLLDPPIAIKVTCFLVILISWILIEVPLIRSRTVRLKNAAFYFLLQLFNLKSTDTRSVSALLLLGIVILQIIGIGIVMIMTPEVLNSEERDFAKSEIKNVIPSGSRVIVPTVPLEHWINYYHEGRYWVGIAWKYQPEESFAFKIWHFLSNPTPETYSKWVEISSAGGWYIVLTNSAKGRSYLNFDLEKILGYSDITFLSAFRNTVFVLLFNNTKA